MFTLEKKWDNLIKVAPLGNKIQSDDIPRVVIRRLISYTDKETKGRRQRDADTQVVTQSIRSR